LGGIGLAACAGMATIRQVGAGESTDRGRSPSPRPSSFADILRAPDSVSAFSEGTKPFDLSRSGGAWNRDDIMLRCEEGHGELALTVTASSSPLSRIRLRWRVALPKNLRLLGDAWERSYGDLGWREIVPEQVMPWYFLSFDGKSTHGYGVRTGASALAFWQCDVEGISLWLDVRNGGNGVMLAGRTLKMATVVSRKSDAAEDPFTSARSFCRVMCSRPRPLSLPIYGSNDWYYAYGRSSAEDILRDASLMAELMPSRGPKPFTIADGGWEEKRKFPDMARLAASVRDCGARPGIWIRPTIAAANDDDKLLLSLARFGVKIPPENRVYDLTIPEAREKALAKVRQVVDWKYDLVKHDFNTFDLLGQWGFEMGASPTLPGWHFHDRSKTNAEIIREFYISIRETAGDETILIGCNVIGHLSAGLFELHRAGDDVSGKVWERTRRMGVNTLAFRLPQHKTFFAMDADCIPITHAIPWSLTKDWLYAVARTGSALLVSPSSDATGPEQKQALREAFRIVAAGAATPEDWLDTHTPTAWKPNNGASSESVQYQWLEPAGAFPFEV
jgi:alpha-galactosidase